MACKQPGGGWETRWQAVGGKAGERTGTARGKPQVT